MGHNPIIKETQNKDTQVRRWPADKEKDVATRQGSQAPAPEAAGGQGWVLPQSSSGSKTPATSDLTSAFTTEREQRSTKNISESQK